MNNEQAINALRCIAYVEEAKPRDRISACGALYKSNTDLDGVLQTLNHLITDVDMPDKDRVNACALLNHILAKLPEEQEHIDSAEVSEALRNQYVKEG